jgi:hypothetical protein
VKATRAQFAVIAFSVQNPTVLRSWFWLHIEIDNRICLQQACRRLRVKQVRIDALIRELPQYKLSISVGDVS